MDGVSDDQPEVTEVIGSETPAVPRRSHRRAVTAGIALVGVGALAGVIAATASDAGATSVKQPYAASATPVSGRPDGPMGARGFGPFGGGLLGFAGQIVHGSAVVKDRNGATKTVEVQNGTVTAVSDKALTVKSSDGFTQSYVVLSTTKVSKDWTGSTASAIKTGDTVLVVAEQVGSANNATIIADGQGGFRLRGGFKQFKQRPGGQLPGGPPAPYGAPPTPNA